MTHVFSQKRRSLVPFPSHCVHFPPQLLAFPRSVDPQADTGIVQLDTSVAAATCASYSARENDLCVTKIKKKNTL